MIAVSNRIVVRYIYVILMPMILALIRLFFFISVRTADLTVSHRPSGWNGRARCSSDREHDHHWGQCRQPTGPSGALITMTYREHHDWPVITVLCCPQVHVATFTDASMMSAEEDSTSSPDDDPYDDTDILNSAGTDEVTAHLAAAGMFALSVEGRK